MHWGYKYLGPGDEPLILINGRVELHQSIHKHTCTGALVCGTYLSTVVECARWADSTCTPRALASVSTVIGIS